MTRKEEREQAAWNYINSKNVKSENEQLAFGDFINGAEWSDKTMLNRVCEYLKPVLKDLAGYNCGADLIKDLRKAM